MSAAEHEALHELLSRDSLAEAEQITDQSYKDDETTVGLGLFLHMGLSRAKEAALRETRDSYFSMDLAETLSLYAEMGFAEVLCDEFTGRSYDDEPAPTETFRILWHPDGLLAVVESHQSTRRNSTKVYYNLAFGDRDDFWSRTSSGRMTEGGVWVGDHDAREGIRLNLARLREVGSFLPSWVERPFLWLVAYSETDGAYDYVAINAERISRLPQHVQDSITPTQRTIADALAGGGQS